MQEGRSASERSGLGNDILIATNWAHAAAHLGLGELEQARKLVDAAIQVCTEQQTWVHLCRCLIVSAAVHRASARDVEAEADLDAAERLVQKTGARLFQGRILEGRGQLREALAHYLEIGAPGHAERVKGMMVT
jgi:tetratricopeptide (TPR) repeat protein